MNITSVIASSPSWSVDTVMNIVVSLATLLMQFYQSAKQGHFESKCCGKTLTEISFLPSVSIQVPLENTIHPNTNAIKK